MSAVEINMAAVYGPSEDVVARKIEGVLILVPLAAGMGDMEDELYTFNDTGEAIWARLDGRSSLAEIGRRWRRCTTRRRMRLPAMSPDWSASWRTGDAVETNGRSSAS